MNCCRFCHGRSSVATGWQQLHQQHLVTLKLEPAVKKHMVPQIYYKWSQHWQDWGLYKIDIYKKSRTR